MASVLLLMLLAATNTPVWARYFYGGSLTISPKWMSSGGTYQVELRDKQAMVYCYRNPYTCLYGKCGKTLQTSAAKIAWESYRLNWCLKEMTTKIQLPSNLPFAIRFPQYINSYGKWVSSVRGSGIPFRMMAHMDLGTRSDTRKPNRPPISTMLPIVRVTRNCPRTFNLNVFDPDGDGVRCRVPTSQRTYECYLCGLHQDFSFVEESCSLTYRGGSRTGNQPIELVVEDFPTKQIKLSYSDGSYTVKHPLSLARRKRQAFLGSTTDSTSMSSTIATPGSTATAGTTGTPGSTATAGTTGTPGSTATAGSTNTPGSTATAGTTGTPGSTATAGSTNTPGSTATAGTTGTPGSTATAGSTNTPGSTATAGTTGTPGSTATAGSTNTPGSTATAGTTDTPGSTATAGTTNTPGSTATAGSTNTPGSTATAGTTNTPSLTATAGSTNTPGSTATAGTTGTPGSTATAGTTDTPGSTATALFDSYRATIPPLSKLPLQFTVLVDHHTAPSCLDGEYFPVFTAPTPANGAHVTAFINRTLEIQVTSLAQYSTIYRLLLTGPSGIYWQRLSTGSYVIRWTPTENELNDYFPICFVSEAVNKYWVYHSELRCVTVDVAHHEAVVTCNETTIKVEVEKNNIIRQNENNLHLRTLINSSECSLKTLSNATHLVALMSLTSCGTYVEENKENITFRNQISSSDPEEIISRHNDVDIAISCSYPKRTNVTLGFHHKNPYAFKERGFGSFTFQFEFFESQRFRQQVDGSTYPVEVYLKQMIYMQIQATSSIPNTELFVESCRATPYDNPDSHVSYTIIEDGCVKDPTVQIYPSSRSVFRFGMEAFEFIGAHDQVYISCSVILCESGAPNTRCSRGCIPPGRHRGKREASAQSSSHSISQGPLHLKASDSEVSGPSRNLGLNLFFIVGSLLVCGAVIYRSRRSGAKYQRLPTSESD